MNLQLSLRKEWFDLTKSLTKTEDYRDITPYWCSRLLTQNGKKESQSFWEDYLRIYGAEVLRSVLKNGSDIHRVKPKIFIKNIMTLGYPKKSDKSKFLNFNHKGISIDHGNPYWGADEGVLYFVIKHGE